MALKAADKKVVDAFTDGIDEVGEGPRSSFSVKGGVLRGPAGSRLAEQSPDGKIVWIGTGGTRYQDDTYRYLQKTVPKRRFVGHGMQPNRGGRAPFGFVHDARTHDFLRPANREDMLKSLKAPSGEYSEGGRRVYVRNGSRPDPLKLAAERAREGRGGRLRKPSTRTYKEIIHEAERDRYPFDYAVRNGSVSDEDWANDLVLRGIVLGFWLSGWASAMEEAGLSLPRNINADTAPEPPEEVVAFAEKFALRFSALNGGKNLYEYPLLLGVSPEDEGEMEEFGYHLAHESQGSGIGWDDDHSTSIDSEFTVPPSEFHVELADPDDEDSGEVAWAEV